MSVIEFADFIALNAASIGRVSPRPRASAAATHPRLSPDSPDVAPRVAWSAPPADVDLDLCAAL